MADLRGISRGSKTATIVVLVVLLQVIVLAFLGLDAIRNDREEGARAAATEDDRRARALAEEALKRTWEGLENALDKAAHASRDDPAGFHPTKAGWFRSFRESYLVDARGRISTSGRTRLHVPLAVVARMEADAGPGYAAEQALAALGDRATLEQRKRLVREHPFRTQPGRYATAVGEALKIVEDEARAAIPEGGKPASPDAAAAVTDAVTLAYETASINAERTEAERPGLAYVDGELDRLLASLPPAIRERPRLALDELRQEQKGLLGFRDYVLAAARRAATEPSPARVFATGGGHLVGLDSLPIGGEPEALLVKLDPATVTMLVRDETPRSAGLALDLVPSGAPAADPALLARTPFRLLYFEPGFDAVVSRTGEAAAVPSTGPRETFYWFILAFATLGLATSGIVLFRILRREVHLARLKTDFVSNLSHELKTPLTSISMFVEMIQDGRLEGGPELREGMDVIAQEVERLHRIVARMIDVARRESASTGYDLAPGDLNGPVRAACERFRRLERDPGLSLEVDLAPSLPPVLLDEGAIDDAVANLLGNAWKYRKGDRARVRVSTRAVRRGVELVVADDGIGIPRSERRRIFEMFYRAESFLTRSVPGTGLGLALVRTIVRVHRGRIRVEGAPGVGTTFRIRLPGARGARTPRGAAAPPAAPPSLARAPSPTSVPGGGP